MSTTGARATTAVAELGAWVRDFLTWWRAELVGMLPAGRLAAAAPRHGERVVLDLAGDRLDVLQRVRGRNVMLGSLDLAANREARAVLAGLVRAARRGGRPGRGRVRLALRLSAPPPLVTTLVLPLAAEENLREAIRFELGRALPLPAAEICFGYRIQARERVVRRLVIGVAALRRSRVDAALARLAGLGIVPDLVLAPSGDAEPDCVLDLDRTAAPATGRTRSRLALAGMVLTLGLIALILPIRQAEHRVAVLRARVAAADRDLALARRLAARLAGADAAGRFLEARKRARPPLSLVLATLARVLPDDTWLVETRIDGRDVHLRGYSRAASALIGTLEGSGTFRDTRFAAPTTRDNRTGVESFSIDTRIKRGGG